MCAPCGRPLVHEATRWPLSRWLARSRAPWHHNQHFLYSRRLLLKYDQYVCLTLRLHVRILSLFYVCVCRFLASTALETTLDRDTRARDGARLAALSRAVAAHAGPGAGRQGGHRLVSRLSGRRYFNHKYELPKGLKHISHMPHALRHPRGTTSEAREQRINAVKRGLDLESRRGTPNAVAVD